MLSVSSQRKYNFYHQNTLVYDFRTNSRNVIGEYPSVVIPSLANQDLTPMLSGIGAYIFLKGPQLNKSWSIDFILDSLRAG